MSEGFRLRIKYQITGRLAYLSHLETIRSVERIVRRAQLPFAITEGFNPHMKIAFGPALPVGAGSLGECVDLRMREYVAPEHALAALRACAPENLMPIGCEYVELGADAIDVAYPVSVWRAELDAGANGADGVRRALEQLVEKGFIEVTKRKGKKETVKRVEFEGRLIEGPHVSERDGVAVVEFSTCQRESGVLRPDRFLDAAFEGMDEAPVVVSLTRIELRSRNRM